MVRFTHLAFMALITGSVSAAPVKKNARVFVDGLEGREIFLNEMAPRAVHIWDKIFPDMPESLRPKDGEKAARAVHLWDKIFPDMPPSLRPKDVEWTGNEVARAITALSDQQESSNLLSDIKIDSRASNPDFIPIAGGVPGLGARRAKLGFTDLATKEDSLVRRCICPPDPKFACACAIQPTDATSGLNSEWNKQLLSGQPTDSSKPIQDVTKM